MSVVMSVVRARVPRRAGRGLACIAAGMAFAHLAHAQRSASEGAWSTAPSLLNARAAHAVVAAPDAIFALAGTGAQGRPVLDVERFDGTAWRVETTLPGAGLNATAAAIVGDRIYVIGGFDTSTNVPVGRVHSYDTRTRTWSTASPLPRPRGGHAAVVLDGRIHVFGGGNSESTIADHSVYDPQRDAWSDLAPLPRAEGSPAGVVHGGSLYAIGGRSGPADFGDVYIFDPARNAWSRGPSIDPRGTASAVDYCGEIHVFGGESQARSASLATAERLDDRLQRWIPLPHLPTARNFARAVLFDGAVFVVGGSADAGNSHGSSGSAVVERYRRNC
jgi:N-acetylneuraminic acid mutarotase